MLRVIDFCLALCGLVFEKDSTKSSFLAMSFKINNQLFLDVTPIEDSEFDGLKNDLYKLHLIGTHTLAKFDLLNDNEIDIKWFSSDKLEELLKENRIKTVGNKIKFRQVG